jgi:hypothetical protein
MLRVFDCNIAGDEKADSPWVIHSPRDSNIWEERVPASVTNSHRVMLSNYVLWSMDAKRCHGRCVGQRAKTNLQMATYVSHRVINLSSWHMVFTERLRQVDCRLI